MTMRRLLLVGTLVVACDDETPCAERAGAMCAIAGTGDLGFNRDGLAATKTDLFLVSAARPGPDGRTYVMDFNNHRLRVIDDDDRVETLIGNGFHAIADIGVPALESPLENPIDFDFLADGRVVFVSYHDPRVLVLGDDGRIAVLAGSGEVGTIGDEGDGGPALEAMFIQLDGIVVGPGDAICVSDSLANRVRRVQDGVVTTVAGTGEKAYGGDDGPAVAAALQWPTALAMDRSGLLFVADTFNHRVRRVDAGGTIVTVAGIGTEGFGGDGGPAIAATLAQPYGVAVADDGTLYVADRGNFRVRRVDPSGIIDTIAGTGVEGDTGDGGPAVDAQLAYVARVALDGDALLVADQSNSRVRRIDLR